MLWSASKLGDYRVNLGYDFQRKRERNGKWPSTLCWSMWPLPKARAFLWISIHGRILTSSRLKSIGISGPNWCIMCKQQEESIDRLLYWCPFASQCWDWLLDLLHFPTVKNLTLKDFLLSWLTKGKFSKWGILWIVSPSMLGWRIWKERNKRIFKEEALEVHVLLVNIKSAIEEVVNGKIQGVNYNFLAKWDFDMEKSWSFKKISDHRLNDRKALRKNALWQAPPAGWKKLNFDGASRGNPGWSGVGAIIRNEAG
ncbi:hypothetical protein SUGI_1154190 [Cryptomeria japonica]|nr:hypothetical protein SUGI_1154190 [Cryptomeria japonica]